MVTGGQHGVKHNSWLNDVRHAALDVVKVLPGQHLPALFPPRGALPLPDRHSHQPSHLGCGNLGRAAPAQALQEVLNRVRWKRSTLLLAVSSSNGTSAPTPVYCHCHPSPSHSWSSPRGLRSPHSVPDDINSLLDCGHPTHQGGTNPPASYLSSSWPRTRPSYLLDSRFHASELSTCRCDN